VRYWWQRSVGLGVTAALDRVPEFQFQLRRQSTEVDGLPAAQLALGDELLGVVDSGFAPPVGVGSAEQCSGIFGPQRAKRQPTLGQAR
jgi:hypothetical protein